MRWLLCIDKEQTKILAFYIFISCLQFKKEEEKSFGGMNQVIDPGIINNELILGSLQGAPHFRNYVDQLARVIHGGIVKLVAELFGAGRSEMKMWWRVSSVVEVC